MCAKRLCLTLSSSYARLFKRHIHSYKYFFKALASAQNSSIVKVSARRVGSILQATSMVSVSGVICLRLARSIFLRWPKAAAVTFSSVDKSAPARGCSLGIRLTIAEVTLGGGTNTFAGTSNSMLVSASQLLITAKRPYASSPG